MDSYTDGGKMESYSSLNMICNRTSITGCSGQTILPEFTVADLAKKFPGFYGDPTSIIIFKQPATGI
jgi:hypothetical protein